MKKNVMVCGMAAALAVSLAGCKGMALDGPANGGGTSAAGEGKEASDELYVYNWGEYIDEDVITQFEEETGIRVVYDLFETN